MQLGDLLRFLRVPALGVRHVHPDDDAQVRSVAEIALSAVRVVVAAVERNEVDLDLHLPALHHWLDDGAGVALDDQALLEHLGRHLVELGVVGDVPQGIGDRVRRLFMILGPGEGAWVTALLALQAHQEIDLGRNLRDHQRRLLAALQLFQLLAGPLLEVAIVPGLLGERPRLVRGILEFLKLSAQLLYCQLVHTVFHDSSASKSSSV